MTTVTARRDLTGTRPSVALVRGEALNPFEMQVYASLTNEFDLMAIGRVRPPHEVDSLPMPVRLLPSIGAFRLARAIHRRSPWAAALDLDTLAGFDRAVAGRDILHAAETVLPVSHQAARVADGLRGGLVLTCWETIPFRYDDDPRLAARKEFVRPRTSHFIAVTERARSALVIEGVAPEKISVVPAAVDCNRFAPNGSDETLRRRWGVPPHALVVLYIGRMIQEKGITELVIAFAQSQPASRTHLVMVGTGNQATRALIAARALNIEDRVHVQPGVSYRELPAHYASADIVVAPSLTTPYWEEQFGMVLAEAMASGRPLITTTSGAIPEVVGPAAVLVPPYDVCALSRALAELCADPARRAELGDAGRQRALHRYALPVVSSQLREVYSRVLA